MVLEKMGNYLKRKSESIKAIYISSYIPRKCGIATYTKDLTEAVNHINLHSKAEIIAMVKPEDRINYGPEVKFKINQNEIESYIKAADYINKSKADILILELEFGLYGGEHGEYILNLLRLVKKPISVTPHTIPDDAGKGYGLVLKEVLKFAEKVIVMMAQSKVKLIKKYNCPVEKIEIIPHGVPDIPLEPNDKDKEEKGLKGRLTIGNINLLSESKGLEYTIEALRDIKKRFPNVLYLIIGQTHPVILQNTGEKYRNFLKEKIKLYNLHENVKFINEYLTLNELIEWLKVIDIYITPYLDPQQSASGALAYAIGAGKACISTPYLYAKEVLADNRGVIVPFRNSRAIADSTIDIFKNSQKKSEIEKKTYEFGRMMTWYNVALQHLELFDGVIYNYYNFDFNQYIWKPGMLESINHLANAKSNLII